MARNAISEKMRFVLIILVLTFLFNSYVVFDNMDESSRKGNINMDFDYPEHENVIVTVFWVGEDAGPENGFIANYDSVWDYNWVEHYGGSDKIGSAKEFKPMENPFYFALPYNDLDTERNRKEEAMEMVYWADEKKWENGESMLKNRWIKITKNEKFVYAQWEDVGPFEDDDVNYVFGTDFHRNDRIAGAGLDVSPAVKDYLGLKDVDRVSWEFVDFSEVEEGLWKNVITESGTDFN